LTLSPPVFDRNVLALHVTGVPKTSVKSGEVLARLFERCKVNEPDYWHRRWLSAPGERPRRRCAAEKRDEIAPSHH
jgi:hypothetical protein